MKTALFLGFGLVGSVIYLRLSVRLALIGLLVATYAVSSTLLVPQIPSDYASVHRIALVLFCLNILLKVRYGRLPASILKPSKLTGVLFVWVVATFVSGVAFADPTLPTGTSLFLWLFVVEQLIFVLFVTAAIRAIGDVRSVAKLIAGVALALAVVAIWEHLTGNGVNAILTRIISGHPRAFGDQPLNLRGGEARASVGLDFSLAFAWVATALTPIVIAATSRSRSMIWRLLPGLMLVAVAFTYTRSAYAGIPLAGAVLVVGTRFDRRIFQLAIAGAVVAAVLVVFTPAANRAFSSPGTEGSTLVRKERLPVILSSAADRPLIGHGFGALSVAGFRTIDSTYLLWYGELGIVGGVSLLLLFGATIAVMLPGLRAPPLERVVGAAALAGVVAGLAAALFLDEFTVSGSFRTFWLLAALGSVVAERVVANRDAAVVRPRPKRAARFAGLIVLPAVLAGVGAVVSALAPTSAASIVRFTTRTADSEAAQQASAEFIGREYVTTACTVVEARIAADPPDTVECYDMLTPVGMGEMRIQAPDVARLNRRLFVLSIAIRRYVPGFAPYTVSITSHSKPTLLRTAPAWLALIGLGIALFRLGSAPLRDRVRLEWFYPTSVAPVAGA